MTLGADRGSSLARRRVAAALFATGLLAAGCGSRIPDEALARYDAAVLGTGNGGGVGAAGGASGSGTGATGTGAAGTSGGATTGSGGSGSTGGAGGGAATGDGGAGGAATGAGVDDGSGAAAGGDTSAAANQNCSGGATDTGVTADEVKVAAMVTASGPLPGATEGQFRGAAAYFAKVNAEGGVCGRKVTILKGDDGLDPQRGRGEFLRLEPQVLAFVGSLSVADSGFIDLIGSTGVPYIGTSVDPAGREHANVLPRTVPNAFHSGPFVYLKQTYPDVSKVGFMFADVGGVRSNTPGTIAGLERAGFQVVYNSGASATSPDFTPEIINLRGADAQMVYLFAFEVNMHVRFARNMRQQNWEPPLKVSIIGYNSKLVELLGDTANGWLNHITYAPMLNADEPARNPGLAEFLRWNDAVSPGASVDLFPVNGWRDAAVFTEALRAAGADVTRQRILDSVNAIPESDGGGMTAPFYPQEGRGASCFVIVKVVGQQWVREYPGEGYECNMGEAFTF